jgi:hypothetical protein
VAQITAYVSGFLSTVCAINYLILMVIALVSVCGTDPQAQATAREAEEAEEDVGNRSISARTGVADRGRNLQRSENKPPDVVGLV